MHRYIGLVRRAVLIEFSVSIYDAENFLFYANFNSPKTWTLNGTENVFRSVKRSIVHAWTHHNGNGKHAGDPSSMESRQHRRELNRRARESIVAQFHELTTLEEIETV